jgi:hypothetical protein
MSTTYPTLQRFYETDPRRATSPERDVGLWWRDHHDASFRAAWVQNTGEIYMLAHGVPEHRGGPITVLGHCTAGGLDSLLTGWRDVCGRRGSVDWLIERATSRPRLAEAA